MGRALLLVCLPLLAGATRVPVTVHVAADGAAPAATRAQIDRWFEVANQRFAAAGIELVIARVADGEGLADLAGAADRHRLAVHAPVDGTLHLFVAARVADAHTAGAWVNGVHWRYAGGRPAWRGRRYVIISAAWAREDTPAHELGHWFGLGHRTDEDNLMTAPGRRADALLDSDQLAAIKATLRRAVRQHELVPVGTEST